MTIFEFNNETDYEAARDALISVHEKNPPANAKPSFVLVVHECNLKEFNNELSRLGIQEKRRESR